MDRDEALELLKGGPEGIAEWNRRREADGEIADGSGADLGYAHLGGADLRGANLRGVDLGGADLRGAYLYEADLGGADLRGANLRGADLDRADLRAADVGVADLYRANLRGANLRGARLTGAEFYEAKLYRVDLIQADLQSAKLSEAKLCGANLRGANLRGAKLNGANLSGANLSGADLTQTDLCGVDVSGANLDGADLSEAVCYGTTFEDVDLSEAKHLNSVRHAGPSTIGINTIFRSAGKIPKRFLRGCGVPGALIAYLPLIICTIEPIQFYSCFISYSTADEEFASRLHNDLQAAGIRCWKWDHDARTGQSLWGEIDEAIRTYDKLILIASESSLKSPAVNREVERAIVQEDERLKVKKKGRKRLDANVLFPIAIDAYLFTEWTHERKVDVTKKVIADAKGWDSDAGIYAKVRDKLIRDLKAEDSAGPVAPIPRTRRGKKPR